MSFLTAAKMRPIELSGAVGYVGQGLGERTCLLALRLNLEYRSLQGSHVCAPQDTIPRKMSVLPNVVGQDVMTSGLEAVPAR